MHRKQRFWRFVVALSLSAPHALHAQIDAGLEARAHLHAAILLRAMAYEHGLSGLSDPLTIAVLRSDVQADGMVEAFEQLAKTTKVANRPLVARVVPLTGRAETLAALQALQPHVVYVPAHATELLVQIAKTFAESHAIVMCADAEDMASGCLLAVEQSEGKARVVVHVSLAQRLGLHFDGRLLQLARVVQD